MTMAAMKIRQAQIAATFSFEAQSSFPMKAIQLLPVGTHAATLPKGFRSEKMAAFR